MESLLVEFWLEQLDEKLQVLILDADATDLELHGDQQDKFYDGYYYGPFCYLPLYIFARDTRFRRSNSDVVRRPGWRPARDGA